MKLVSIDEVRLALSAGLERSVMQNAVWGTSASYTFSPQSVFRGFLTDVSNTPNNAAGFREDIEIHDIYADSHIIWPTINNSRTRRPRPPVPRPAACRGPRPR